MTRKKAGQNPTTGDLANVPIHAATPLTKDGPEGYSEDGSIGQSEDDETKTSEQDIVTGSSGSSKRTLALESSRFGSPFAYLSYQDKHDFFKGLLAESTGVLFDQIVAEASTLRERLSRGFAFTNDGSIGQFCMLKECGSPSINSSSGKESNSDDSRLNRYFFGPNDEQLELPLFVDAVSTAIHRTSLARNDLFDSSNPSSTTSETSRPDNIVDVRRVRISKTGETEYFVINEGLDLLSINGKDVDSTVIAGPLPDFAVFETGHTSIFWWRTAAALDYMPSHKRKRNSEDNDEESSRKAVKGDTGFSISSQVFPDSKHWLDEYRRRVKFCEERPIKYTSSITDLHPPHQCPPGELHDIDVILAIGAVWLGLINAKVDFAYADSNLFAFARSMRMVGMHAVNGSDNHFLIPLTFNKQLEDLSPESEEDTAEPLEPVFSAFQRGEEEKNQENFAAAEEAKQKDPGNKNKPPPSLEDQEILNQDHMGGIGHFVLAIAERVNTDGPNRIREVVTQKASVRLRFMDSAEGIVDKGVIRRAARDTVRNSGWLGDIWPCFDTDEEYWMEVLEQSPNRCGEHTVLNAWAYMLGIPLATTRERGLAKSSYDQVRQLIRLALRGQLDSLTIRAWMQHYRYAVKESLSQVQQTQIQNSGLPNKLRNMQTVALNEDAFNKIVDDMHTQEKAINQGHATIWGTVTIPSGGATIEQLGNTPKLATGVVSPPFGQDPVIDSVADSSSTSGNSASSTVSAQIPSPPQVSVPSPTSWWQSLIRGIEYHKAMRAMNPRTTEGALKDASIIRRSSNMADDEVVLGIAPIWEGLQRLRRADVDFTYAGMDTFSPGYEEQVIGAVGRLSRFIMPLYFAPPTTKALEDQGKGEKKIDSVGHLLLCVAELVNSQPMVVQLQIFDSCPGIVNIQQIVIRVRSIIHDSGWLGVNADGTPITLVCRPCILKRIPRQVGFNTCGLHVIFNAWATMLDIPINPNYLRRGRSSADENDFIDQGFLARGLEIVNLALGGFMDSATIQAFFNAYGYSVEQRFGDPARSVIPVNAVGMNLDKFRLTLQKRKWTRSLESAEERGVRYPDADIASLVGQGLSETEAWRALSIKSGDPLTASDWHLEQEPCGSLPKPEEALSPKTPDRGGNP